ncbi:MAG: hypothetical protein F6K00_17215 [Leptolyngbya sp. SIOISBB]|nr:hypothetical protein [Leptolyngbya sp. SIOISBB]
MKRPWTFQILLPLVMLILLAVSCDRILRNLNSNPEESPVQPVEDATPTSEQSSEPTHNSTVLVDDETDIQITLPESWVENTSLHDSAELQAADTANELYVIVLAEDSPALMRLGLQDNAARYRALIQDQMAIYEGENPTEVAFIDDDFASQYEIRGSLEGDIPVVYLHTTVVTQQRYYQIVAWTSPQQYDAYRSEMQTITATFQEIES